MNDAATIVGLDLSLTATGFANDEHANVYKSRKRGVERLADLRDFVTLMVSGYPDEPVLVVLEGYSYASGHQAHQLGELGGVIRLALHEMRVAYVEVAPATLKKFATGKGNANKSAMGLAAARNGYDGPGDDNAIDAWWLRLMGLYAHNQCPADLHTAYRDEAIAKTDLREQLARPAA